jgi:hypothetical protein
MVCGLCLALGGGGYSKYIALKAKSLRSDYSCFCIINISISMMC